MECLSPALGAAMRDLLESPRSVVATVALSGGGFISEVKTRKDAELIVVTPRQPGCSAGVARAKTHPRVRSTVRAPAQWLTGPEPEAIEPSLLLLLMPHAKGLFDLRGNALDRPGHLRVLSQPGIENHDAVVEFDDLAVRGDSQTRHGD